MRKRGSITVFAALSIMLIAQLLFTLFEAARHREYEKILQMNSDSVLESIFADYCSPLWDTYHLLGFTAADSRGAFSFNNSEAQLRNLTGDNLGSKGRIALFPGVSLLCAAMTDGEFSSYTLMTDQGGRVFATAVCEYMKQNIGYETAKSVYSDYEAAKKVTKKYGDSDESIDDVLQELNRKGKSRKGTAQSSKEEAQQTEDENVLTVVSEAKKDGVLSQVLPDSAKVSGKALNLSRAVSHRTLEKGTANVTETGGWYDKVLLNQYFVNYLTCYTNAKGNRGLDYELEYLIAGKSKDSENLRVVVGELLAMREASNMATLMASPEKQAEALAMATAIAAASLNPVVIEVVKYAILAAWAYAESVLDVRTLLSGGKIAFIKSDFDWTSNLSSLGELLSGWSKAKNCAHGLSYQEFLALLLLTHGESQLSMRAMDVEEAAVRLTEGYELFRMDHVVCQTKMQATYEYRTVALGFVTLLEKKCDNFRIQTKAEYSYLTGKEGI